MNWKFFAVWVFVCVWCTFAQFCKWLCLRWVQAVIWVHVCRWCVCVCVRVFLQLLNYVCFIPLRKCLTFPNLALHRKQCRKLHTNTMYCSLYTPVVFYCQSKSNNSILLCPLSLCLPSLPHRSKTLVYSTHEAASLLNIYFSSFSLSFSLGKKLVLLCVFMCVCVYPAVCFFSMGKWLLNSIQTMINGWSEPDG